MDEFTEADIIAMIRSLPSEQRMAVYAMSAQMGCPPELLAEGIAAIEEDS